MALQFGEQIRQVATEALTDFGLTNAHVRLVDKGALDCTIKARVECAVYRSNDITEALPWGGVIR